MKNKEKQVNTSEEKVRKFPKFYILDAVIIVVLLAIFLGVYFRYNVFEKFSSLNAKTEVQITFSIKNISSTTISEYYVKINDEIRFEGDGAAFGTLIEVDENLKNALKPTPASEIFMDNGQIITVPYPQEREEKRQDAVGKIKCMGAFSDDGAFMLDGSKQICAGESYKVCTEKVTFVITVTAIQKIS